MFFFALEYRHLMTFVPSFNRVKFLRCNMSHVKWLPCFPTLTDGLRGAPGAVVKAGPLGWANQTVSRLAAKTQQALGFKFFPSQTSTVGRHPRVSADSWTYTYIYIWDTELMTQTNSETHVHHWSNQGLSHFPDDSHSLHRNLWNLMWNNSCIQLMSISLIVGFSDFM